MHNLDCPYLGSQCEQRGRFHGNKSSYNGLDGIVVQRSSTAWIARNVISGNKLNGIVVYRHSQATIGGNTIDGNGGDAISVSRISGVTLGNMGARRDGANGTKRNKMMESEFVALSADTSMVRRGHSTALRAQNNSIMRASTGLRHEIHV